MLQRTSSMKIEELTINEFARPELTFLGAKKVEGIEGQDVLIHGENQSGKTLCFNAILYSLLNETIELQVGYGNSVELELNDGTRIERGKSGLSVNVDNEEYGPEKGEKVIQDLIGNKEFVRLQFLHTHLRQLPLEQLNQNDRIEIVVSAMGANLTSRLTKLEQDIEAANESIEEKLAEISSKKRERSRLSGQVSDLESQVERWKTIDELLSNGDLQDISEKLKKEPEIEEKIQNLTAEKHDLFISIQELENEKSRVEDLQKESEQIIKEALEEFVCPVCEGKVGENQVETRLENRKCPFCNKKRELDHLFEHLEAKKEEPERDLDEIEKEIDELRTRREEVKEAITDLENQLPIISQLNSTAVRLLRDHDHSIEEIKRKTQEKLPQLQDTYSEYETRLSTVNDEIRELEIEVEELRSERETLKDNKQQLEQDDYSDAVSSFEGIWEEHYRKITPELARPLFFDSENGSVILQHPSGPPREYDRPGDLSDSEITLINLSFSLALNEWSKHHGTGDLDTIILDEPFARLDPSIKKDAIEYLNSIDEQIILTSSDEHTVDEFKPGKVLNLERTPQTQLTDERFQQ